MFCLAKSMEPQIQRKKRVDAPSNMNGHGMNGAAEPYILLGQNEKFASNIPYKSRSKTSVRMTSIF